MAPIKNILVSILALSLTTPILSAPVDSTALSARQLAGTGAAADSILSSTDNGVGYGIENAEDNTANTISGTSGATSTGSSTGGSTGGGKAPPPPPPTKKPHRRQADKVANGAAAIIDAAGAPAVGSVVKTNGDNVDGELTSGQANAGAQIGQTEESTLESAGSAVPKL